MIEGPDLVIHQSEAVLASMNAWCVEQHGKSGLTERVRASGTSLAAAEEAVLAFVAKHAGQGAPIAGNSVHADLAFIKVRSTYIAASPAGASFRWLTHSPLSRDSATCRVWLPRCTTASWM